MLLLHCGNNPKRFDFITNGMRHAIRKYVQLISSRLDPIWVEQYKIWPFEISTTGINVSVMRVSPVEGIGWTYGCLERTTFMMAGHMARQERPLCWHEHSFIWWIHFFVFSPVFHLRPKTWCIGICQVCEWRLLDRYPSLCRCYDLSWPLVDGFINL